MTLIWLAMGIGCIWHGVQVIWVAPTPTQLRSTAAKQAQQPVQDRAKAYQIFWLDQYAWIGIVLVVIGLACLIIGGLY